MTEAERHARGTLDDLAMRRRTCVVTIRQIAAFYGLDPTPWLEGNGETFEPPREPISPARETTRPGRGTKPGKGETARPIEASLEQKIRAALTTGPQPLKALVTTTHLKLGAVQRLLRAMADRRIVTTTGKGRATRYQLT